MFPDLRIKLRLGRRFAQHDKSKKLGIELYENLTLQCTRTDLPLKSWR